MIKKISAIFLALVLCLTAMVVPVSAVELADGMTMAFELKWDKEYYSPGETAYLQLYLKADEAMQFHTGTIVFGLNSAQISKDDNPEDDVKANSVGSDLWNSFYKEPAESTMAWLADTVVAAKVAANNTAAENEAYDIYFKHTVARNLNADHANAGSNKYGLPGSDINALEEPIITYAFVVSADAEDGTSLDAAITSGCITGAQTAFKYIKTPGASTTGSVAKTAMDVSAAVASATIGEEPCKHEPADEGVVTTPATCKTAGVKTLSCTVCEEEYTEEILALGHTEEELAAKAPTCEETGLTAGVKCSVCGDTITAQEEIPAAGHDYETVVTDPTCEAEGYTTYSCNNCDSEYVSDKVAALGHTDGEPVVENSTAATCGQVGSYENVVYCTVCNKEISREKVTVDEVPHSYTGVVTTAPTCEVAGVKTFTCSVCGDTYTEEVAALGHDMKETAAAVAPSCEVAGSTAVYTCANSCGKTEGGAEVAATGHDMQETTAAVAPSCEVAGSTAVYTCANGCGKTEGGEEVAATGHDMKAGEVVAPTCTKDGYTVYTCANGCGTTENKDTVTATGHDYKVEVIKDATCTAVGKSIEKCTVCNAINPGSNKDIPVLGHDMKAGEVTAPTCEEAGYTTYTCANGCGETEQREEVAATGHSYGEPEVVTPASCLRKGKQKYTCSVCGGTKNEDIPAVNHKYPDGTSATVEIPAVAPTCTNGGFTAGEKCAICNTPTVTPQSVPKKGHTKGELVEKVDASYEAGGYSEYTCSDCGEQFKTDFETKLSVSFTFKIAAPSTRTLRARDTIVLRPEFAGEVSDDITIVWTADNKNFKITELENGEIKADARRNGTTVFTATVLDAEGREIYTDSVELTSNAKFFQRIAGFFRVIFKKTINYDA